VSFDINEATVLSGAVRQFKLRGTADRISAVPDVTCTNNIQVSIPVFTHEFTMPEVSVLTEASCIATLTDSAGRTRTDTITFTILPRTDIGQVVGIYDPPLKLVEGNSNLPTTEAFGSHIVGVVETPSGDYQIRAIGAEYDSGWRTYYRDDELTFEGTFRGIDYFDSPSLLAHGLPSASYSVVNSAENTIYWHAQDDGTRNLSLRETISGIDQPCFLRGTDILFGRDLIVGTRNSGFVIFDLEPDPTTSVPESFTAIPRQYLGAGRSFCHVQRGPLPRPYDDLLPYGQPRPWTGPSYANPVRAIDFDALEIVYYGDANNDNTLVELGSVPIETNSTKKLEIIQVISTGTTSQSPNYVLLLLTDGSHNGEHRVIQLATENGIDDQRIIHEWTEGVPVAMLVSNVGGELLERNYRSDLVVVLGTTEESLFFDNIRPLDAPTNYPIFAEPTKFKVGIGAGSAVAADRPWPSSDQSVPDSGVLISYPETGEIVYVSP